MTRIVGDRWVSWSWPSPVLRRDLPAVGELVAWEWAVWRVVDVLERVHESRPRVLWMRRECGPPHPWERAGDPGVVHLGVREYPGLEIIREPYPVCSCHGHPWPCTAMVEDRIAQRAAETLEVRLARALPGVCAACGEPVTIRQRTVTFPGENLLVPGGPPVTYHLRAGCRDYAHAYELRRLTADPTVDRLCTCPGTLFEHLTLEDIRGDSRQRGRRDCSAGPGCTGHHYGRGSWCGTAISNLKYGPVRPWTRCDQPRCHGGPKDLSTAKGEAL